MGERDYVQESDMPIKPLSILRRVDFENPWLLIALALPVTVWALWRF